jgi:hypothetical protein
MLHFKLKIMKSRYNLMSFLLLVLLSGCSKNFLNRQPLDQYSEPAVWADLNMMENFLNNIYGTLPGDYGNKRSLLSIYTDESQMNPGSDAGHSAINSGAITASSYGVWADGYWYGMSSLTWDPLYKNIRACNLFLTQSAEGTYDDEERLKRMQGEAHFLRAYLYHKLAFLYGGVPLIDKVYTLNDSTQVPRNTFKETINFIVNDCDQAAALLPLSYESGNGVGRAAKGAALALKARTLLYAASDLYHTTSWAGSYSHPELVGYVGEDRTALWRAARDAAKAVVDLHVYDLYKKDPAPGDYIAGNYQYEFTSKLTEEDIFVKFYSTAYPNLIGQFDLSSGYHGWGNTCPLSTFVDAYEMRDGTPFDWNNPVHRANPYENRDPRLYGSIFFNGARWRQRSTDYAPIDPVGIINTSYQQQADGSWKPGLDVQTGNASTRTGYYMRKFLDSTKAGPTEQQYCSWRYIRYAEVLLTYAEASAEIGEENDARTYVNMVRKRAGMPDITTTGAALIESIRHERKIELMGEGQRFWDIRRWMIAPQVMTGDELGIDIRYASGQTTPTYKTVTVGKRAWANKCYFLPILISEINKNERLVQNPLY